MGVILSKFRKAKPSLEDSLEKIDKELTEIRRFQIDTEVQQKRIIGRLSLVAFLIYAIGILAYYLFIHTETFTWGQHALSLLPFVIFPAIIWSLRRFFGWWYQRQIVINKEKSDSLRKERERLLDEVMDKETFKVAKKILEKYAPSHLLPKYLADQQRSAPGTPLGAGGISRPQADGMRRRTIGGAPPQQMMGGGGMRPQQLRPGFPPQFRTPFRPMPPAIMAPPGTPRFNRPSMQSVPTGFTPMRFMLPQAPSAPVMHNRKTGWIDKIVDYVVGDGPTHRFALICRYCATHNGLATPDDFPFTGYRCIYCRQFNPPKQQRPSAPTLPRNTVLIEEMDSTIKDASSTSAIISEDSETEDRVITEDGDGSTNAGRSVDSDDNENTSKTIENKEGNDEKVKDTSATSDLIISEDSETEEDPVITEDGSPSINGESDNINENTSETIENKEGVVEGKDEDLISINN